MSEPIFRNFAWSDVPAITAIYRHAVETSVATFDTEAPGEAAMAEKFGRMLELGHPVIIAEAEGKTIGYAYASTYRPRPAYRFTAEDSIYLAPEAQGKGLGSALLWGGIGYFIVRQSNNQVYQQYYNREQDRSRFYSNPATYARANRVHDEVRSSASTHRVKVTRPSSGRSGFFSRSRSNGSGG